MALDGYKLLLYRNEPEGWVVEILAIEGCYALMSTREEALAESGQVFEMIADEYREKGVPLPIDTTEIVHAWRSRGRFSRVAVRPGFQRRRRTGSHQGWIHQDGRAVTIPIHRGREIGRRFIEVQNTGDKIAFAIG